VAATSRRTPKNYDGTKVTTHRVSELLPFVLGEIGDLYNARPDLLLAAWPDVIGPKLALMTQAVSFNEGVLLVKVKNSSLHSLLSQHDKQRILSTLRARFPRVEIRNVVFRIG
jgi:hypothetical protein